MRSKVISGLLVLIMLLQLCTVPVYANENTGEVEEITEVLETEESEEASEFETIIEELETEEVVEEETIVETTEEVSEESLEGIKESEEEEVTKEEIVISISEMESINEVLENNVENSVVFEGGDGTIDNPYQISNANQLDAIRNDLSANYVLINNIDLTKYGSWNPIGVEEDFEGNLEGNNYKIIGLTLDNSSIEKYIEQVNDNESINMSNMNIGLFGRHDGEIRNVILEACIININMPDISNNVDWLKIGAFSGIGGDITQCIVNGQINVSIGGESDNSVEVIVGGLIGWGGEVIKNSINNADIFVYSNDDCMVGGITGEYGDISNCTNNGNIYAENSGSFSVAGGIVGNPDKTFKCVNYGNVTSTVMSYRSYSSSGYNCEAGGIAGEVRSGEDDSVIEECMNYGNVTANNQSNGTSTAGGILGYQSQLEPVVVIKKCINYGKEINAFRMNNSTNNTITYGYGARICGGNTSSNLENNYAVDSVMVNGIIPVDEVGVNKANGASFIEGTIPWEMEFIETAPTIWFTFDTDQELEYSEGIGYNYSEINLNLSALCMIPIDNSDPTYENVTVTVELPEGLSFSSDTSETIYQQNIGTMSLSGTKRQDMSVPVYLDNDYYTGDFEVKVSVIADGYSDSQSNTYTIEVKEIPNYSLYNIQVYSEFSNCNIGVDQAMVLLPVMVKDGEVLEGEDGWAFTIEDSNIAEILEYTDTEYGPAATIKGKSVGSTKLNILHISTGKSVDLSINVVDTTDFFNVTWLENIEENQGIYNAGIYMENFKASRYANGYNVTFDAYNGVQHHGAIEIYDADGNLLDIQKISKFDRYQTGLEEVLSDLCNLIYTSFNGTISSYKNEMYSKKTSVNIWVPDDGYIYISNNMSQSIGAYIYNTVDLAFWAFTVGSDVEKALKSDGEKEAIIETASESVIKQYIEAVKSVLITDATKEKFQKKLYKSITKDISTDLITGFAETLVNDSDGFYKEWNIDLWSEFTDAAKGYGDDVLVDAFEKVGGPAGVALSGIFKTNEYINRFMQLVDIQKTKDIKEIKIYVDGNSDKIISNDVVIENAEGAPIVNNMLVVTDISVDESSQYIIEDFKSESQVKILDITMYRDNEEVQPDGKIRVKIPIPALYDKDKCVVYRAEQDGSFTNMEAYYEDGFMVFETTHLSKYLLVEEFVYSIVYDGNGASIGVVEPLHSLKKDIEYTLALNNFIREGYVFAAWNTKKDGSGESFFEGETIKNLTDKNGDAVILYAQWEKSDESDILPEDLPSDGIIPDGIWSAGITDLTYTGSSIKQSFRVYDGKKLLKEKTDYTVSYKNNKNAYTYLDEDYAAFEEHLKNTGKRVKQGTFDPNKAPQVTIKMKGNYSGSQTVYFKINQADISGEAFSASDLTVTYSGKKQTPTPTLMWNGKKLKYGTDFYVPEYDAAKKDKNAFKDTGTYTLTITGKKNFMGELPVTLTISNSVKQIAMNKVTVKGITSQKWTGEQIVQSNYKVSYSKDVLTEENGDFTISWGANSDVGTGTVTFTGTGEDTDGDGYSYIGTKTVSFKITGTAMSKVTITGVNKSYTYTGSAIEPEASVTYKASKKAEPVSLTEGIHYTVSYQKNTDKGTATIVFTGLASGGYTGTKKVTFKIVSSGIGDIKDGETIVEQIEVAFKDTENVQDGIYVAPYMKGGAKPEIIVTCGEKTLLLNKDYTVSYTNNKKVALSTDKKAPYITIKGKGNYSGSKKVYFTIAAKPLTNENGITIVAKDKIASTKKNGYKQSFKVYDLDGKALGSSDYNTKTVTYTLVQTENEDGTISMPNQVLDKNSVVPANSVIRITVQGKGNYAGGEACGTYRILENSHDISKAVIQINNQAYTGNPVLITDQNQFKTGKVYIKIGKTTEVLILGEDIEVVSDSYVKNVNKGTAKVTFRGINEFGGTKTVSYKIGARSIGDFWKGIYTKVTNFFN